MMCTSETLSWCREKLTKEDIQGKRVIEVGSYIVTSSIRVDIEKKEPAEYVGVDIEKGPGVDVICRAENLVDKFGKESFDVVVSTCTLEHIQDWRGAVSNIKNICKPNGLILLVVPSEWNLHEYPEDWWRYRAKDIQKIFDDCNILLLDECIYAFIRMSPIREGIQESLVFVKIRKPRHFVERSLSEYQLPKPGWSKGDIRVLPASSSSHLNPHSRVWISLRRNDCVHQ